MSDDEFVREARESVRRLSGGLVELERGADRETVDELFRHAHGLKGLLAMRGYDEASDLAHAIEDLLDAVRAGRLDPAGEPADRALAGVDALADALADVARDGRVSADLAPVAARIREVAGVDGDAAPAGGSTDGPSEVGSTADGAGAQGEPRRDDASPGDADPGVEAGDHAGATDVSVAPEVAADVDVDDGIDLDADADLDADGADGLMSAEEALDAASEFDDLESLVDDVDDADEFADLEGGGSFDDIAGPDAAGHGDGGGATGKDAVVEGSDAGTDPEVDSAAGSPPGADSGADEIPDDPAATFAGMRASVDRADTDSLQRELESVEFGEFDEEDDLTIDELLAGEDDATDDGDLDRWTVEAPADDPQPEAGTDPDSEAFAGTGFRSAVEDEVADVGAGSAGAGARDADPDPTIAAGSEDAGRSDDATGTATASDDALARVLDVLTDEGSRGDVAGTDPADDGTGQPVDAPAGDTAGPDTDVDPTADAEPTGSATAADPPSGDGPGADLAADALADVEVDPDAAAARANTADVDLDAEGFQRDAATEAFEARFADAVGGDDAEEAAPTARPVTTIADSSFGGGSATEGRGDAAPSATGTTPESGAGPASTPDPGSLSVDVDTAERLLRLVEDVAVERLALREELSDAGVELPTGASDRFDALAARTDDLRRTVMDVRLQPLSSVTDRLPRVARDAARREDKDVDVVVEGADVKLDRDVIARAGDALGHLVRNAVSHGIEAPDARAAPDKPPTGTVTVRARRDGDDVEIEVTDDGRGIDVTEVRERAIEAGLVTADEAAALSRSATYDLLFRAGFTTTEEVTGVSGRGVGLDAVGDVVSALDGSVELKSTPGEGTTVRLRLPVTVAMAEVLFVTVGDETYALPTAVVEGVDRLGAFTTPAGRRRAVADGGRPGDGDGTDSDPDPDPDTGTGAGAGRATATRTDDGLPVVDLREAFDVPGPAPPTGERFGVRVVGREGPAVLAVDAVGQRREAVVDPFDDLLSDTSGVSGTTVSTDGHIVNVIDIDSL